MFPKKKSGGIKSNDPGGQFLSHFLRTNPVKMHAHLELCALSQGLVGIEYFQEIFVARFSHKCSITLNNFLFLTVSLLM